jgi:hypothetical protein
MVLQRRFQKKNDAASGGIKQGQKVGAGVGWAGEEFVFSLPLGVGDIGFMRS